MSLNITIHRADDKNFTEVLEEIYCLNYIHNWDFLEVLRKFDSSNHFKKFRTGIYRINKDSVPALIKILSERKALNYEYELILESLENTNFPLIIFATW